MRCALLPLSVVIAGEHSGFLKVRTEVRARVERFLKLTGDPARSTSACPS
jgi:hypothetical protein